MRVFANTVFERLMPVSAQGGEVSGAKWLIYGKELYLTVQTGQLTVSKW